MILIIISFSSLHLMLRSKKKRLLSYYRDSERKHSVCVSFIIWRAIHTNIFLMKINKICTLFAMEHMELNNKNIIQRIRVFGIRRRLCL